MGFLRTLFTRQCQTRLVMHNELAEAIVGLTAELREAREERRRGLATKTDLRETEKRIIAAIEVGPAADLDALRKELKGSTDALKAGVEANPAT